jgi:hypothetical protein
VKRRKSSSSEPGRRSHLRRLEERNHGNDVAIQRGESACVGESSLHLLLFAKWEALLLGSRAARSQCRRASGVQPLKHVAYSIRNPTAFGTKKNGLHGGGLGPCSPAEEETRSGLAHRCRLTRVGLFAWNQTTGSAQATDRVMRDLHGNRGANAPKARKNFLKARNLQEKGVSRQNGRDGSIQSRDNDHPATDQSPRSRPGDA